MIAAAVALAAAPCTAALCDAERLRPFFDRLTTARAGGEPVRIVQIGDSHTAGDQISGAWRNALQVRHGIGGRGMLAPGRPYQGYMTRNVTAAQSPGWTVRGIFGASYSAQSVAPLGLSGYTLSSAVPGAWLSLSADEPAQGFDRFVLCGWTAPGNGTVQVSAGATSMTWSLDAPVAGPACRTIETGSAVSSARVSVVAGPVTLSSWMVERRGSGGVSLSNLGVVGAQLVHLDRADERLLASELSAARPDLIVLAFGTNEAFRPNFSAADYDATLQRGIRRVQRLAPGVPVLLMGAPDSATRLPALQRGEAGALSTCPNQAGWAPPAALAVVQDIQRRRAHELGVAYWDWGARMGGRCTADAWVRAMPPKMRGDRVHFTRDGAQEIARMLQQDLDAAAAGMTSPTIILP